MDLRYRLLNVFSIDGVPFSGNPLCVFEGAVGLDDVELQAWARQFNLSETSFITALRSGPPEADVRIFTASYEMPFAGHPTLGTAQVVAELAGGVDTVDAVTLSMPAGVIPVRRMGEGWQLRANFATARQADASPVAVGAALGIRADTVVAGETVWVDAGVEQLLVHVDTVDTVRGCVPDVRRMNEHLSGAARPPQVYVWAWAGESQVEARFFGVMGSMLEEDPATGSAAANLGSWLALRGSRDLRVLVHQGAAIARPSRILVTVDDEGTVFVAGRVTEVGSGVVHPPEASTNRM